MYNVAKVAGGTRTNRLESMVLEGQLTQALASVTADACSFSSAPSRGTEWVGCGYSTWKVGFHSSPGSDLLDTPDGRGGRSGPPTIRPAPRDQLAGACSPQVQCAGDRSKRVAAGGGRRLRADLFRVLSHRYLEAAMGHEARGEGGGKRRLDNKNNPAVSGPEQPPCPGRRRRQNLPGGRPRRQPWYREAMAPLPAACSFCGAGFPVYLHGRPDDCRTIVNRWPPRLGAAYWASVSP